MCVAGCFGWHNGIRLGGRQPSPDHGLDQRPADSIAGCCIAHSKPLASTLGVVNHYVRLIMSGSCEGTRDLKHGEGSPAT
jgi:hypothetical protein